MVKCGALEGCLTPEVSGFQSGDLSEQKGQTRDLGMAEASGRSLCQDPLGSVVSVLVFCL